MKWEKNEIGCDECFWSQMFYSQEQWEWFEKTTNQARLDVIKSRQTYETPENFLERNPEKLCPNCKERLDDSRVIYNTF